MITVYSKPNCPYCDAAKIWLNERQISFEAIDVSKIAEALEFLRAEGHRSVPQIYHNRTPVQGGYAGLVRLDTTAINSLRSATS